MLVAGFRLLFSTPRLFYLSENCSRTNKSSVDLNYLEKINQFFEIKKENCSKFYIEQFSLKQIFQLCIFITLIHKLIFYLVSLQ